MPHCQAARRTNPAAQRAFKERLGLQAPDNLGRLGTWTLGFLQHLQHSRYTSFKPFQTTQRIPVAHSWSLSIVKFLIILAAEAPQKRGLKFDWLGAEFNRYSHYSHAPHMLLTCSSHSPHILKVKPAPSQHRHDAKICHGMSWHKRWNQTTLWDERWED